MSSREAKEDDNYGIHREVGNFRHESPFSGLEPRRVLIYARS